MIQRQNLHFCLFLPLAWQKAAPLHLVLPLSRAKRKPQQCLAVLRDYIRIFYAQEKLRSRHSERSEESQEMFRCAQHDDEILRCTQDDENQKMQKIRLKIQKKVKKGVFF